MNKENETRYCSQCGARLMKGSRYCESCGARVKENTVRNRLPESMQQTSGAPGIPTSPADAAVFASAGSSATAAAVQTTENESNSKEAKQHKASIIISIVMAATLVLGVCGYASWRYYTGHSHSYAQQRYAQSLKQLKDADLQLTEAVSKANASTRGITATQVDEPDTLTTYTEMIDKASKLISGPLESKRAGTHNPDESGVHNPNEASVQELNNAADVNEKAAKTRTDLKILLENSAQKVTDSRDSARKTLGPVEKAVATAEKQKQVADKEARGKALDTKAIASGDYSSLDGTWTNDTGAWMKIKDGKVTPQNPILGTTAPYTLRKCVGQDSCVSNSILTGEYGTYTMQEVPDTQIQLMQDGAVDCIGPDGHGGCMRRDPYSIVAVQKDATLLNMSYDANRDETTPNRTDSSRDRIIVSHSAGQGGTPLCIDASFAYYRDESTLKPSASTQRKLDDAVESAQQSVDGLTQPWAETAKSGFQCRLDVVSGKRLSCPATAKNSTAKNVRSIKAAAW